MAECHCKKRGIKLKEEGILLFLKLLAARGRLRFFITFATIETIPGMVLEVRSSFTKFS